MIDAQFDAVVIGGGANGTGLARDLSLRGIKVALFEKGDFAGGATGASSGMIHGGPRYLLDDTETTKHACKDAGYIRAIAPHLCFRIPFLLPIPKDNPFGAFGLLLHDVFFDVYDRFTPFKGGVRHARVSTADMASIEPGLAGDFLGGVTLDEWGIDVGRLCLLNALDAEAHGAICKTYTEVTDVVQGEDGRVRGVKVRGEDGVEHSIGARAVINCAGPWADRLAQRPDGASLGPQVAGPAPRLRPGKGVHLIYDKRLSNFAIITAAKDGRQIFVMPYMNETWIGTTDDDYYGSLDDLWANGEEVAYLREAGEAVLPALKSHRLIGTRVGVRNTVYGWGVYEDALSRRYEVVNHEKDHVPGFYTLLGGKLASYRVQASEAADAVCQQLGVTTACETHKRALPGGDATPVPEQLAQQYRTTTQICRRLIARHGSKAHEVLDFARSMQNGMRVIDPTEPTLAGEVAYSARFEHVVHLSDLMTRCRLAMGADMGLVGATPAGHIVAAQRGWDVQKEREEVQGLLARRWRSARPILEGAQVAQWELWQEAFAGVWEKTPARAHGD